MSKERGLPKYYNEYKDANGRVRLQYKRIINGKRHTLSCKYDPREDMESAFREVSEWMERIKDPNRNAARKLPEFVKKFTVNDTLAKALEIYVVYYKNIDPKRNRRKNKNKIVRPAPETVRVAKDTIKLIAKYPIGKIKLKDLTETDIQDFIFDLADKYTYTRGDTVFRYGPNTCNKVFALLKGFVREMEWEDELFKNVQKAEAKNVQNVYHTKSTNPEDCVLDEDEKECFIRALFATTSRGKRILGIDTSDAIFVMLDCALRPGEIRGVQKGDFIEGENSFFIQHNIPKGERNRVKDAKAGNRKKVYLSDVSVKIVKEHLKSCISDEDFIFKTLTADRKGYAVDPDRPTKAHMPLCYSSLYQAVKRTAKRAQIGEKSVYPYLTRHTAVNEVFAEAGAQAAQAVARHSSVATTMRFYSHAGEELAVSARDRRNQWLSALFADE